MRLRDLARGRWKELLPQLGVDARYLRNIHGPCPVCGGEDRFRWDDQHGDGGYICGACGAGDGFSLAMKVAGRSFQEIAGEVERILGVHRSIGPSQGDEEQKQRNAMRGLWDGAVPVADISPVAKYLRNRLAGVVVKPDFIREHKSVFADGKNHPAMLAKVITCDDRAINIHCTFVTPSGQKAALEKPRKVMPGKLPDGCAVRLFKAAPEMGVAEGIETAISASLMFGMPVWACLNANLLSKWIPPKIAERIYIFADNDENFTGQAAAYQLARRLSVQFKLMADVFIPEMSGQDWNDVWMDERLSQRGAGAV